MTSENCLLVEDHGATRVLTINRPERRNALNVEVGLRLREELTRAEGDAAVRVLVITGAGGHYSAGADIQVFAEMAAGKVQGDPTVLGRLDQPLARFPKPLIAAVDGQCVGMALTTLPLFDMVYASERATFQTPFVRLGLVVEMGASYTLPRLIGRQRANELVMRATPLDARTAESWGLVTRVFASDKLMEETLRIAGEVALGGPESVAHCKRLLLQGEASGLEPSIRAELDTLRGCYASTEHKDAVRGFFQRKAPKT